MKRILAWILAVFMLLCPDLYDVQAAPSPVFAEESQGDGKWRATGRVSWDVDADCKTEPRYQEFFGRTFSPGRGGDGTAGRMRLLPGLIVRQRLECWKKESDRKAAAGRREPVCMRAVRTIYFAHGL